MARRALVIGLFTLSACSQHDPLPQLTVDASASVQADASCEPTREDRVAPCDQAADGTPCGGKDNQHCIFGVCAVNLCGDGVQAGDETCDDGNQLDGDMCPSHCGMYACRNGRLDPGEECDDGDRDDQNDCSNSCTANIRGNGRKDPGEECDDGNRVDTDDCSNAGTVNKCGNQRLDPGEVCDGDKRGNETCKLDCSGYGSDTCTPCVAAKCLDYQGFDLYTPCRISDASIMFPMKDFVPKCSALDDCIRSARCFDATTGSLPCLCGSLTPEQCQGAASLPGMCGAQFLAATDCSLADSPASCALGLAQDTSLPAGLAWFLDECRRSQCESECGY